MIAVTMLSCFERAVTSRSGLSSPLPWERRLLLTMAMTTVSATDFSLIPMVINFSIVVGRNNRHCLCKTCEDAGRGGYTPEEGIDPPSDSDSDASDRSSQRTKDGDSTTPLNVNERRTRRGVYAVMPENQIKEREQSTIPKIELDTEDSILSLTLPSPSASEGALLETPQLSRESSIMSSTFHITVPSDHRPGSARGDVNSVINDTDYSGFTGPGEISKSDAVVRTSARLRDRSSKPSSLNLGPSRLATPEDRLRSSSRGRTSGTEPPEQRVLRPRASDLGPGKNLSGKGEGPSQQANPTKKPLPKGVPTCVICKGILPVISVDSEIVWGLEGYDEKGKKLKGRKASSFECPRYATINNQLRLPANMLGRCMRHREIYNVSWPYRLVSHGGTTYPTPPPVDPPVTSSFMHSSKSREVSISRSISSKATSKNRRDEEDQRPTKRQKVEAVVEAPPVERSRSGRPHIPSRKLRESTEDREKSISAPQKSSQAVKNSSKPKEPLKETALQPAKKSRAERADERSKIREQMERTQMTKSHSSTIPKTPVSDASGEGTARLSTSSRKRPRTEERVSVKRSRSTEAAEASEILASPPPRPSLSGMRGFGKGGYSGFLGVAPNPINLARRKWVPVVPDSDPPDELIPDPDHPPRAESSSSSTTEDSLHLTTPRDSDGLNPTVNPSGETEDVQTTRRPRAFLSRAMKPSPVNFAMRRWSGMGSPKSDRSETDSQDELDDPIPRTSTSAIVDITLHSSPQSTRRPSARFTTPEPRSYVPSRIWETGDDVSLISPRARHILISTRRVGLPSNRRIALYLSFGTRQHLHPLPAAVPSRTTQNAWLRGWCMPILRAEMTRAMFNRSLTSLSRLMDSRRVPPKRSLILYPVFIWTDHLNWRKFPCPLSQPPLLPPCLLLRS